MGDVRAKAVPEAWAGPVAVWCVELAAGGRTRQTVALRRAHVAQLARAVGGSPADLEAGALLGWLASRVWEPETRRAVRASLRGFFVAAGRPDLAGMVPRVRASEPLPRPTPDADLAAAMRAGDERTRLVLRLAAEAGMRRGEIAQVHADDLGRDAGGALLLVHGKGGRRREVPISDSLAAAVRLRAGGGWVFPGQVAGHLSARRVGELAVEALPHPWTLHSLRHRFATRAHEASRDLIAVSRLLGHASVATTQRYVATDAARLRAVARAAA